MSTVSSYDAVGRCNFIKERTVMSTQDRIEHTIPSKLEELSHIEKMSSELADRLKLNTDQRNNLSIAITEAVGNAISHGNQKDPSKNVHIHHRRQNLWQPPDAVKPG